MGGPCPFQQKLQWDNNKFEEWGTPEHPFRFMCHIRYVEVDLEDRVPGIFPGRHLWYTRYGQTDHILHYLTVGHILARSSSEVVFVVASHQKFHDTVTAQYGIARVSRAMELPRWHGDTAGDPLQDDFDDDDLLLRWKIAVEAGPEIVLRAQIPPYIPHVTSYIADLVRPCRDRN